MQQHFFFTTGLKRSGHSKRSVNDYMWVRLLKIGTYFWLHVYVPFPSYPISITYLLFVFGLGLACQAKGQCCHTKKSTLAKIFTEKNE